MWRTPWEERVEASALLNKTSATPLAFLTLTVLLSVGCGDDLNEFPAPITPTVSANFAAILPAYVPDESNPDPVVSVLDPSELTVDYFQEDLRSGHESGARMRIVESQAQYVTPAGISSEIRSVKGVEVTIGYRPEWFQPGLLATWNHGGIGYQVQFLWWIDGVPQEWTTDQLEEALRVIDSLIR